MELQCDKGSPTTVLSEYDALRACVRSQAEQNSAIQRAERAAAHLLDRLAAQLPIISQQLIHHGRRLLDAELEERRLRGRLVTGCSIEKSPLFRSERLRLLR